jgi:ketosteroid isomerase-like protein
MNALEIAQRSFDAWNRHDADAIVGLFAEGGTHSSPRAGKELTGKPSPTLQKRCLRRIPTRPSRLLV